ncbi:MAG: quinol:electron acceptor oxidoreductase subunit ActD, partial [Thermodesulfobacteriota bacterium]
MAMIRGLIGVFTYLDDVLGAIERLQQEKVSIQNVYSPTKRPEILEAMKTKPSRIRLVTLVAAILGGCSGLALASYAHLRWR